MVICPRNRIAGDGCRSFVIEVGQQRMGAVHLMER